MDNEGRNLRIDFDNFSVMSLYLPSGTNIERLGFKFKYMDDFASYINELKQSVPKLIIGGDYNICHNAIDIHDPIRNAKVSGFLPEEREWLDTRCLSFRSLPNWIKNKNIMEYKNLPNTDIQVSKICLGTMTWGRQNSQDEAFEQMNYSVDRGVNFFDTAELYPVPASPDKYALTEKIIGNWFQQSKKHTNLYGFPVILQKKQKKH